MSYINPPCPWCSANLAESDDCLKCEGCGEVQSFAYRVHEELEQEEKN